MPDARLSCTEVPEFRIKTAIITEIGRLARAAPTTWTVSASLPFFVKWFVHFDNVSGSKERGLENLESDVHQS